MVRSQTVALALLVVGVATAFAPESGHSTTFSLRPSYRAQRPSPRSDTMLPLLQPDDTYEDKMARLMLSYGEQSRKRKYRSYFTSYEWIRSRRSDRLVRNILTVVESGLLRQLGFELSFMLGTATFVTLWNALLVNGYKGFDGVLHPPIVDSFFGFHFPEMELPVLPFTLMAPSLGLLLAFRTNVSYSRWNEARTAWGKVINDSRSIVRMGATWSQAYTAVDDAKLQRLGEAVCSFSRCLQNRVLTPQEDELAFLNYCRERLTDKRYAEELITAKHRPTAALAEITSCIVDLNLNPIHQVEVERPVTGLCDALGASERIFTSPVPLFYTKNTARFLALWLIPAPLGLYGPLKESWNHWAVIPTTVLLSAFFLGIDELATQLEEPFSILPMEKMCEGSIATPIMEQVERSQLANRKWRETMGPF